MTAGAPAPLSGDSGAEPAPVGGGGPHPLPSAGAPAPWPYPRWIAHRGAGKLAPENTLAAFRVGASHGYRMFECDAKLSADGVPFLLHDDTLERTTNGHGIAGEQGWHLLSQLDAGSWHGPTWAGEPLPTLAGVIAYCQANVCWINIEIKPTPGLEHATGVAVAREARRLWPAEAAGAAPLLTSFRPESLAGAREGANDLPRGLLLDSLWPGWLEAAVSLGCCAIVGHHRLWDPTMAAAVHGADLRALSYTVNDEPTAQRLLALGLDGIITDAVDRFSPLT